MKTFPRRRSILRAVCILFLFAALLSLTIRPSAASPVQRSIASRLFLPLVIRNLGTANLGWRIDRVDNTHTFSEMGNHSIAISSTGLPRIAYGGDRLYFASLSGATWTILTADTAGSVGKFTSLAIDENEIAHISYYNEASKQLKYARQSGTTWVVSTVDASREVGMYSAIVLDRSGHPHIAYFDDFKDRLKYAVWNGVSWDISVIDESGTVGTYISMAIDGNDNIHIVYYDFYDGNQNLKYLYWNGSGWQRQAIDIAGNVGSYASIALDLQGLPYVSYFDESNDNLKYAHWNGSQWIIEVVDADGTTGLYTSIAVDATGAPGIAYYDKLDKDQKVTADLMLARRTAAGWVIEAVETTNDVGKWASLVFDGRSIPHISYFDATNTDLRYAVKSKAP